MYELSGFASEGNIILVCHYFFMLALMDSFVVKIYSVTNMTKNHVLGQFYIFSKVGPNLFIMVQAATVFSSLAKIEKTI